VIPLTCRERTGICGCPPPLAYSSVGSSPARLKAGLRPKELELGLVDVSRLGVQIELPAVPGERDD
jgi:hypothetical protein